MARRDGLRRLVVGLVGLPLMLVIIVVLLVIALPVWLLNNLWALVFGSPLLAENSRVGYWLFWAQGNVQAIVSGRGDFSWTP